MFLDLTDQNNKRIGFTHNGNNFFFFLQKKLFFYFFFLGINFKWYFKNFSVLPEEPIHILACIGSVNCAKLVKLISGESQVKNYFTKKYNVEINF